MPTLDLRFPRIYSTAGEDWAAHSTRLLIATGDASAELAPGSWIVQSAAGFEAVITNGATAGYVITRIWSSTGYVFPFQHRTAAELAAANHYVDALPITAAQIWEIQEDGDTTPLTDANTGIGDAIWGDIIVGAMTGTDDSVNPYGQAQPNIQLDSTSVATSRGNTEMFTLHGPSGSPDNPAYDGTTSRAILVKVASPGGTL